MLKSTDQKIYSNSGNESVLSLIPKSAKFILDIGCGRGDNATKLKKKGYIVDGITLSQQEADEAIPYMRNVYIFNLENGLPPLIIESKKFDVVICSHVLEHICYPQNLLSDIKKILSENAILIIALPNLMNYKSRIELIKGNFHYQDSGVWDYTHFRWYTFNSGIELLKNNGFVIEKSFVTGDIPFLTFFKFLPIIIRQKLFLILTKISKGLFGGQIVYVAKK